MAKILKIFGLILLAYGNCEDIFRIKYGQTAKEGQFPFYAELVLNITLTNGSMVSFGCGATLIHPQWLLTAGHCFAPSIHKDDEQQPKGRMKVFMGSVKSRDENAQINYIKRIYMHEKFYAPYKKSAYNDIALCKLYKPYELNRLVRAIRLPVCKNPPGRCEKGVVVGMGQTEFDKHSDYLLYGVLERKSSKDDALIDKIIKWVGEAAKTKFYFQIVNKTTTHFGDSGGPFLCYGRKGIALQYGVVSGGGNYTFHINGKEDKTLELDVFEDITKHKEFIFQYIPRAQICGKSETQQWRIKKSGQSHSIKIESPAGRVSPLSGFLLCFCSLMKYGH